ncbi:MAG: Radical domain protein [Herbinix sp.]|jgi:DNA repair photolyase|nr:Radical domain protein [Herbinix sp.]
MNTIPAKTIIASRKDTSWFGTEYNMNIYKGCNHGCIYCDSRSDCYQIPDFDTVRAKENAIDIIREELRHKTKTGVIGTGSMSDPYNPYEEKYELTRQALDLINTYHFGVAIATKSALIARDIDILTKIKAHSPLICKITITAFDDELSRTIEPGVNATSKRLEALRMLSEAGIFTGVLMMPLLPYLTDTPENVSSILHQAKECGARFIYPLFGLTLRSGQREYFYQKLEQYFPEQKLKDNYIRLYGSSYVCHSPREKELSSLFKIECEKLGLLYRMEDIIAAYRKDYEYRQLSFFS